MSFSILVNALTIRTAHHFWTGIRNGKREYKKHNDQTNESLNLLLFLLIPPRNISRNRENIESIKTKIHRTEMILVWDCVCILFINITKQRTPYVWYPYTSNYSAGNSNLFNYNIIATRGSDDGDYLWFYIEVLHHLRSMLGLQQDLLDSLQIMSIPIKQ